jgi:hypothetical protein
VGDMIQFSTPTLICSTRGETTVTLTVTVAPPELRGASLDIENAAQRGLNQLGQAVMKEVLDRFDTQGEPICVAGQDFTPKGRSPATYNTLFGPVAMQRHVYQNSDGGRTYCPLEQDARMCRDSTLGLSAIVALQHASLSDRQMQRQLALGHQLELSRSRKPG